MVSKLVGFVNKQGSKSCQTVYSAWLLEEIVGGTCFFVMYKCTKSH